MSEAVSMRIEGEVAIIEVQNPPVNALGHAVRLGLMDQVTAADEKADVKAIIIAGAGRTFPAGADITEFGGPVNLPMLPEVINLIEACTTPVIAAIHGTALGGGFEIALGSHYRIADASARVGLPEIHIGVFPGAGGTQRMPRLAGMMATYDVMLSGAMIGANDALKMDVLDAVVEGDLMQAALGFAKKVIDEGLGPRPTRDIRVGIEDADANRKAYETAKAMVAKERYPLMAHAAILKCVSAAPVVDTIDEGFALERENFMACMNSAEAQGLMHAFFADRLCTKVPEAGRAQPRALNKIAVIGGGTMGAGITCAALDAGLPVVMVERDDESIKRGRKNVERVYDRKLEKGKLSIEKKQAIMDRYTASTSYDDIADADLIIEAVFERMDVKKEVFAQLDGVAKPGAVLASNTSYLDIDEIASATKRPQDVIGLHFFSPANVMKLLEIVIPSNPADDAVATGFALAKKMRKTAVRAGNCDGFIGNRILGVYAACAQYMMEDGASPYDIDRVMVQFGYPMGPFSMFDLAGGDIGWDTRKRKAATRPSEERYVEVADKLCERGWFGQKSGRGWYKYEPGARRGTPDPEVIDLVNAERIKKSIIPRGIDDNEILMRYMCAMINEGANCVHDGTALRPSDVDVTKLYGYGFPRHRGGPMKYADMMGLDKVLAAINEYAKEDPYFWKPSPLLVKLVEEGKTFASLNK